MSLGIEKHEPGTMFQEKQYTVVKKVGNASDTIEKHNHPDYTILFTVIRGTILVTLNEVENHTLSAGMMLRFDGTNFIQAKFIDDGECIVTLLKK